MQLLTAPTLNAKLSLLTESQPHAHIRVYVRVALSALKTHKIVVDFVDSRQWHYFILTQHIPTVAMVFKDLLYIMPWWRLLESKCIDLLVKLMECLGFPASMYHGLSWPVSWTVTVLFCFFSLFICGRLLSSSMERMILYSYIARVLLPTMCGKKLLFSLRHPKHIFFLLLSPEEFEL